MLQGCPNSYDSEFINILQDRNLDEVSKRYRLFHYLKRYKEKLVVSREGLLSGS